MDDRPNHRTELGHSTYAGFKETGPDHHQHVWTTATRLPEPPTELKTGMLPANTTIRLPMVTRREREWNEWNE